MGAQQHKIHQEKKNQKIALVTGANRGIGLEVSRQLARKGLLVILTSRNASTGREAQENLHNEGFDTLFHTLDVTDQKSVDQVFDFVAKEFGRLDVLVNNAGILIDSSKGSKNEEFPSLFSASLDTVRKSLETNTYGAMRMIQKFAPLMKTNHYGRIVNLSSGMGQLSEMNGGWPGYRLSKTALNALTRIAADELKGTGVLVNSVCPGWVKTDMGGTEAELTVPEGADTVVWLATLPESGPSGGFFRERQPISW
jgi:NAD(P)-dependent dehydrogenase (short-subunit alcohol dehydrogenase family)